MPSSYTISRKANFATACKKYKIPKDLSSNPDFEAIFDILNRDDSIIAAICKCEEKKTALSACAKDIEKFCKPPTCTIDLANEKTRQCIGLLQKAVLEPFGYQPTKQKHLYKLKFFKSASCYERTGTPSLKIIIEIHDV